MPDETPDVEDCLIDFRYAPPSRWTLLCHPDDPDKTLLREDGALLYDYQASGFDTWHFGTVLEFRPITSNVLLDTSQRTESARRPITHTTLEYADQSLELVSFAYQSSACRADIVLWTLTAKADGVLGGLHIDAYLSAGVLAGVGSAPHRRVFAVRTDAEVLTRDWVEGLPTVDEQVASKAPWAICSLGPALIGASVSGFRPASGLNTMPIVLGNGEAVHGAIVRTFGETSPPADATSAWATSALAAERDYWDGLTLQRHRLEVPDERVQDLVVASARNILQAREIENGLPVLHVGPTIYRGLWLVDGHFLLEAARYLGLDETADAGLEVLLRRVRRDGSIIQTDAVPHIKETGVAISTIVRQAELTGDADGLRRRWPVVRAAVDHIKSLQAQADDLPLDHPLHGLMPEGFADGGIGGTRAEYTNVLWTLIGLRYASHAADWLGEHSDAADFALAYKHIKSGFDRSAKSNRRASEDDLRQYLPVADLRSGTHQFIPNFPDDAVPHWRRTRPETATWAMCHAIWPGEVFEAADIVVTDLLDLLDDRDDEEGIPATTGWLSYEAIWTYFASFAAHAWLYAGRPDKAVDYLYAFANHAAPTRVWREEQSLARSSNSQLCGDMPHNWASAEFIRLVRHMLVFERGATLELLPAVPASWFLPGRKIHVEQTPTQFGPVDLCVACGNDKIRIYVTLHKHALSPEPVEVVLHLPSALGGSAAIDGMAVTGRSDSVRMQLRSGVGVLIEGSRK